MKGSKEKEKGSKGEKGKGKGKGKEGEGNEETVMMELDLSTVTAEELEQLLSPTEWEQFKETFLNTVANRRPDEFGRREKIKHKWSIKLAHAKAKKKEARKQELQMALNLNLEMKESIYSSWEELLDEDNNNNENNNGADTIPSTSTTRRDKFSRWDFQDESLLAMMLAVRTSVLYRYFIVQIFFSNPFFLSRSSR